MSDYKQRALDIHKQFKGKISISLRDPLDDPAKLGLYYTPGVGAVSSYVAEHPEELRNYTWTNNLVAVISDGSAVLGLGNIGPKGSMPVMEGKALLFKHFADIDSVPITLDVHTADEIVATVRAIAPSFGAINLEDIAAPLCFEIEERLKAELDIPVFHDDQHGTAIVVAAGLLNALELQKKQLSEVKIVCIGAGAAGIASMRLLVALGADKKNMLLLDTKGVIHSGFNNNQSKSLSP